VTTFKTSSGSTLSYSRRGEGPLVVCIPGGPGMDPEAYCAPLDLPGFELLVFAPRGTGESSPPPSPDGYRIAGYVADVESLREHLGTERLTIYGSSHGGSVALAYATAHPDRVERLIVTNPPWRMDAAYWDAVTKAGRRFTAGSDDGATRLEEAQSAGALLRDPNTDLNEEQDHQYFRASLTIYVAQEGMAENDYLNRLSMAPRSREPVAVMYAEFADGLDLLAGVGVVQAPALVIGCEYDITVPVELTRLVAEALPNARYVEFEGIGHLPEVEAPERFRDAVTQFLG
jgi:pimeloyl-ACP methyl ester carboxylesterase